MLQDAPDADATTASDSRAPRHRRRARRGSGGARTRSAPTLRPRRARDAAAARRRGGVGAGRGLHRRSSGTAGDRVRGGGSTRRDDRVRASDLRQPARRACPERQGRERRSPSVPGSPGWRMPLRRGLRPRMAVHLRRDLPLPELPLRIRDTGRAARRREAPGAALRLAPPATVHAVPLHPPGRPTGHLPGPPLRLRRHLAPRRRLLNSVRRPNGA